jgi:hypothetical protein
MKKKRIIVVLICTIASIIAGFIFRPHIYTWYENFRNNHFTQGDKLYVTDEMFTDRKANAISFYKILVPLNKQDSKARPYADYVSKSATDDLMIKQHSAFRNLY